MSPYIYVLKSLKDGELYTGSTTNLKERLKRHEQGHVPSTRDRRPLELIYYEFSKNEHDNRMREKYLKTGRGKKYLKVRLKSFWET